MKHIKKSIVTIAILASVSLASCSAPWNSEKTDTASTQTGKTQSGTAKSPYKQYTSEELDAMKPEELVNTGSGSQSPEKIAEFKDKLAQYRNNVLKKVAFRDEKSFRGPEDIREFMKTKGFKFDNSEFSFSSDLGGYVYLSQTWAKKLGIIYGSRQWESVNEYVSKGTLAKRPELKKVMVPAFQMELGLDDMGKVVEVTDKKFDPEQREKMEAVQKKIMALNVGISGRTYGTDNPPEAMTPEKMKEKMEAVRQFEVEAMEIRSKLYIVGEAKTDSPIVGKKIWEFEVK